MSGFGFMNTNTFSCSAAAAGSSARNTPILDTAGILAVSICVLPMVRIRLEKT